MELQISVHSNIHNMALVLVGVVDYLKDTSQIHIAQVLPLLACSIVPDVTTGQYMPTHNYVVTCI